MTSFNQSIQQYRAQLNLGYLQAAYKGLLEYMLSLRTHIKNKHPEYSVPGGFYPGYMDMSYFAILPAAFKQRGLKAAIVFLHHEFRFEIWLAAVNKQVQLTYWQQIQSAGWTQYALMPQLAGEDAILTHVLIQDPQFDDLESLTALIETGAVEFIEAVSAFLEAQ